MRPIDPGEAAGAEQGLYAILAESTAEVAFRQSLAFTDGGRASNFRSLKRLAPHAPPDVRRIYTMAFEKSPTIEKYRTHETDTGSARVQVAVLTDGLWKRRFGGDPAVLGRTLQPQFATIDGEDFLILEADAAGGGGETMAVAAPDHIARLAGIAPARKRAAGHVVPAGEIGQDGVGRHRGGLRRRAAPVARGVGRIASDAATVLIVTSWFACVLSMHNVLTRYGFSLGTETRGSASETLRAVFCSGSTGRPTRSCPTWCGCSGRARSRNVPSSDGKGRPPPAVGSSSEEVRWAWRRRRPAAIRGLSLRSHRTVVWLD